MSWYKRSYQPPPIGITAYDSTGNLSISFNGGRDYEYVGVNPYWYDKIRRLLAFKNYKEVSRILPQFSSSKKVQK